jgi:hypothetical protein
VRPAAYKLFDQTIALALYKLDQLSLIPQTEYTLHKRRTLQTAVLSAICDALELAEMHQC